MLGIYCRISKLKEEGKDRSISDQKLLGFEKAKELGLDYELFIDEGLTAYSDSIEDRPEFERFLERISSGYITAVFAFDQSRFERNPLVRFIINDIFKKHSVKYYTHIDGLVDLYDPQAELLGDMVSVMNKYQVTMTKQKVASVLKRRVASGKAHGIIPYGYGRDVNGILVINEEEANVVRRVYELSFKGMGTRSIANYLNDKKIPTRYNTIGKGTISVKNKYTKVISTRKKTEVTWAGNTIRGILTNPIYYGKRTFSKIIYEAPALFDEAYWIEVNNHLKTNCNNRGKKVVHDYLLKGLIRCGVCERNMYGRTRVSKKDNYYMCSSKRNINESCGNRSINIDRLDSFIWGILFGQDNFIERLEAELFYEGEEKRNVFTDINNERKKFEGLKNEKQKSIILQVKGIISEQDLTNTLKILDADINKSEKNLKEMETNELVLMEGQAKILEIKDKFADYTNISHFAQKIKVINELIKNIIIKFNESYYEISVEYMLGLPSEVWKTTNQHADYFYRVFEVNGLPRLRIVEPIPISKPETKSSFKKLFKGNEESFAHLKNMRLLNKNGDEIRPVDIDEFKNKFNE